MLKFSEIFEFSKKKKSGKFLFWKNSNGSNGSVPRRSNLSTLPETALYARSMRRRPESRPESSQTLEHLPSPYTLPGAGSCIRTSRNFPSTWSTNPNWSKSQPGGARRQRYHIPRCALSDWCNCTPVLEPHVPFGILRMRFKVNISSTP